MTRFVVAVLMISVSFTQTKAFSGRSNSARLRSLGSSDTASNRRLSLNSSSPCSSSQLTSRVPRGGRRSATELRDAFSNSGGSQRSCQVLQQLSAGHVPDHLRNLVPIQMGDVTICVMPDYMSMGTDADGVRVPLGRNEAVELAREMGFMLPTTRMVDQICRQARGSNQAIGLNPSPMPPGSSMTTTDYFYQHDRTLDQQIANARGRAGQLVGCHKKDLVMNRISQASRVPIYGWNRTSGAPIQPLSTVHENSYADYSHGVRLVSQTAFINGQAYSLADLLSDPQYAEQLRGATGLSASDISSFNPHSSARTSNCFTPRGRNIREQQAPAGNQDAIIF